MNILVLNCGSSSVKFQIIATDLDAISREADRRVARGSIERIGGEAIVSLQSEGQEKKLSTAPLRDTQAAVESIVRWACSEAGVPSLKSVADIHAVGHRVVHGGEHFTHSVVINDEVLRAIEDCIELAPLHNPMNIRGILAARSVLGAGCHRLLFLIQRFTRLFQNMPTYTRFRTSCTDDIASDDMAFMGRHTATLLTGIDSCKRFLAMKPTSSPYILVTVAQSRGSG